MKKKLVNVRLDPEDAAKVRSLQERGIELASIVRTALRSEYARRARPLAARDVARVMAEIYAAHPEEGAPRPAVNVHDRRAFQRAIRRHVLRPSRA